MNYNTINSSYEFRIFLHRHMSDSVLNNALRCELEKFYEVSANTSDSYILKPKENIYSDITDHYPYIDVCIYNFLTSQQNIIDYISDLISKETDKSHAYKIRFAYDALRTHGFSCSGMYQLLNMNKDTLILSF